MDNRKVTDFPERIVDRGLVYVRDDKGVYVYNLEVFCSYTLESAVGESYPPQITCKFAQAQACAARPQEQVA